MTVSSTQMYDTLVRRFLSQQLLFNEIHELRSYTMSTTTETRSPVAFTRLRNVPHEGPGLCKFVRRINTKFLTNQNNLPKFFGGLVHVAAYDSLLINSFEIKFTNSRSYTGPDAQGWVLQIQEYTRVAQLGCNKNQNPIMTWFLFRSLEVGTHQTRSHLRLVELE